MIGNLMARSFDFRNQLRVTPSPFSDKKKSSLSIVTIEDLSIRDIGDYS